MMVHYWVSHVTKNWKILSALSFLGAWTIIMLGKQSFKAWRYIPKNWIPRWCIHDWDAFMSQCPHSQKIHLHSYTHIWIYQGLIEVCVGLQCHPITFRHRPSWAHGWRAARSFQIPGGVSTSSGDRAQPWRPVLACKSKCKVESKQYHIHISTCANDDTNNEYM